MSTNNSTSTKISKLSKRPTSSEKMKFNIIGFYKPSSNKYISVVQSPKKSTPIFTKSKISINNKNKNKYNNTLTFTKSFMDSSVNTTKTNKKLKKNIINKTLNNTCSPIGTLDVKKLHKIIPEENIRFNHNRFIFNPGNVYKNFFFNYKKLVPPPDNSNHFFDTNNNLYSSVKNIKNKKINLTSCNNSKTKINKKNFSNEKFNVTSRKTKDKISTINNFKNNLNTNCSSAKIRKYKYLSTKNSDLKDSNRENLYIDYARGAKISKIEDKNNKVSCNKLIQNKNFSNKKLLFSQGTKTPYNSCYNINITNDKISKKLSNIKALINKQNNKIYKTKCNSIEKKNNENKNLNISVDKSFVNKINNLNKKNTQYILDNNLSVNLANDIIKQKMQQILVESEREILKIKKNFVSHFTSNNSPSQKKSNRNSNSKHKIKNSSSSSISIQKKNNNDNNNDSSNTSTNVLSVKKKLETDKNNLNKDTSSNVITTNNFTFTINNIKPCNKNRKNNNISNDESDKENNTINKTICHDSSYYMNESIKLTNYIKEFFIKNKKYPETNLNFYKYGRIIGQGAFGKVNIGLNILTGRIVAIKSFDKGKDKNGENMKKIYYETNLMKKLSHPNVTKILEMFNDENYFLIVMEYINGGNLFSFVKKRRKLSEKKAKFLFKQIILGIQYIHSKNIVHRDIKLENILIDLNNNIKICDFGIGIILNNPTQKIYDQCGTPMYMAPEILISSKKHKIGYEGFPVDIWSCGIALYIMLSGKLPFTLKDTTGDNENGNLELQYDIINNEPKDVENISYEAKNLLKGLLNKNPNKRLTCEEILNHPWLNDNFPNNKKYNLFTKAEMKLLSKTFIDYRNSQFEDLVENFSISNLKRDDNINNKNITEKSTILTPYNSVISELGDSFSDSRLEEEYIKEYEDFNNNKIKLENDLMIFGEKPKEFNMFYELNNNGEVDNGILINSKTNTTSSVESYKNNINENKIYSKKLINSTRYNSKNNSSERKKYNDKGYDFKILNKIEKMGYSKEYVVSCMKKKELCHATSLYFLLENYENI